MLICDCRPVCKRHRLIGFARQKDRDTVVGEQFVAQGIGDDEIEILFPDQRTVIDRSRTVLRAAVSRVNGHNEIVCQGGDRHGGGQDKDQQCGAEQAENGRHRCLLSDSVVSLRRSAPESCVPRRRFYNPAWCPDRPHGCC